MARDRQNTPSPAARLGLVLILGLLAIWIMPLREGFIPGFEVQNPALTAWLATAFIGILLLNLLEGVQPAKPLLLFMGFTLALSLVKIPPAGEYAMFNGANLAKNTAIGLLLLAAGVITFGQPIRQESHRPWTDALMHGAALAVASPLLLFASRPQARERIATGTVLSNTAFVAFLFAWAAGSPVTRLDGSGHWLTDKLIRIGFVFNTWSWLGCGMLYLLSPWPREYLTSTPDVKEAGQKGKSYAIAAVLAGMLVLLLIIDTRRFQSTFHLGLLLVYLTWKESLLLILLCPWPRYPRLPKIREPAPEAKIGMLGTVLLLAPALVPLVLYTRYAFLSLFTGRIFSAQFNPQHVGWVLDQSTVQCGFWRSALIALMVMSYAATVRWLSDRSTRLGYWTFTAPVATMFLCLLCYWTCVYGSLLVYIHAMGITPLRLYGVVYGLGFYAVLLGFLGWLIRPPEKKDLSR